MKSVYKMLSITALSGMLTLSLAFNASAQHDHGGGGGGSHPSGGGGGGGGHVSAPAPSSRSGYSAPRASVSQPRVNTNTSTRSTVGRPNFGAQKNTTSSQYSGHTIGGGQRTGVTTYRTYQGSAYGHNHFVGAGGNHGYLPGNTYYHYNHGNYRTYYTPRLGFTIGVLPYGYYPFYFGDYEYFYSGGLFYEYDNDQYTVVEPPVGAEVTTLPSDAQSIVINGQQFYEENGVYYKPVTKDDGTLVYEVAGKDGELNTGDDTDVNNAPPAPQIGDIIQQLPQGTRKLNINGQVMFMSPDGIYYQSFVDQDGNTEYKIVGLPDDDQDNNQQ